MSLSVSVLIGSVRASPVYSAVLIRERREQNPSSEGGFFPISVDLACTLLCEFVFQFTVCVDECNLSSSSSSWEKFDCRRLPCVNACCSHHLTSSHFI